MTLNEFITLYDKENSIVLLEGKRKVLDNDKEKLTELGKLLTANTKHIIFRSGNAAGADYYFSLGVTAVDYLRLQVITPYCNHRTTTNKAYETISLDNLNLAAEPEVINQSKKNKKTKRLIDSFVAGDLNRNTIKAAYIIRDTIKAIGSNKIKPATFGIFYDDLANLKSGGTGHTINIFEQNNIPVINQSTWLTWLN